MNRFIAALTVFVLAGVLSLSAFAENNGEVHNHWRYTRVDSVTYTEETHTLKGICTYDDYLLGYCGMRVEKTEAHTLQAVGVMRRSDWTYVDYKCTQCPNEVFIGIDGTDWMSALPDDAPIGQVNIPGSASCTTKYTEYSTTQVRTVGSFNQNTTIAEQLNAGSRIMHVDFWVYPNKGFFASEIWPEGMNEYDSNIHGTSWKNSKDRGDRYTLARVKTDISQFLEKHPTEFVVLAMHLTNRNDVSSEVNKIRRDYAYAPDKRFVCYSPGDRIPTVGEVRGKCVMLFMNDNVMNKYAINGYRTYSDQSYYIAYEAMGMAIQPEYNYGFPDATQDYSRRNDVFREEGYRLKSNQKQGNIRLIAINPEPGSSLTPQSVSEVASKVNNVLLNAKLLRGQRLGWFLLSRVDNDLCRKIYETNLLIGETDPETIQWPEKEEAVDHGLSGTDWMKAMPDNTQLTRLNIPGTHDSGAYYMYGTIMHKTAQCQDLSLTEQFQQGIRLLDIRAGADNGKKDKWPNMMINHNDFTCYKDRNLKEKLRLRDVMDDINVFLKDHPTETILMCISEEGGHSQNENRELIAQMRKEINAHTDDAYFRFIFVQRNDPVPLLGDVRGKCVIYWENDTARDSSAIGCTYTKYERDWDWIWYARLEHAEYALLDQFNPYLQDYSIRSDVFSEERLQNISRPGDPMVRFVGYNSNTIEKLKELYIDAALGPRESFNRMKSGLEAIRPSVGRHLGWISMDFPTQVMIFNIVNTNRLITTACSVDLTLEEDKDIALTPFSRAQLVRRTEDASAPVVVATLSGDAWKKTEEPGGYSLDFRVYDETDTNGDSRYSVVFPDADNKAYEISVKKEVPRDTALIRNASVHTINLSVADLSGESRPVVPPRTGDASHPVLWSAMLILTAAAGIFVLVSRKGKRGSSAYFG